MRFFLCILLAVPLLLNCPRTYTPKIDKIEVYYLGSLYEDIYRDQPLLSGTPAMSGMSIGHMETDPPILAHILGKLGFFELLDEFPIDFVVSDTLVYDVHYLSIPTDLGYGITNYEGIRFAVVRKGSDSLTINDQVQLTLIEQRSDVLWLIDQDFIKTGPRRIDFYIENRQLTDTSTVTIEFEPDTTLAAQVKKFRGYLDTLLSETFILAGKEIDEFILSAIAEREDVNIVVYPHGTFSARQESDTVTLFEITHEADWRMKLHKITDVPQEELSELIEDNDYSVWGNMRKTNHVLVPDNQGTRLFDLFYPIEQKVGE